MNIMIYYTIGRSKMDIFVLKAMLYLDNPELFTSDEMWESATDAADAGCDYAAAATAYSDDAYDVPDYDYWLDIYFKKNKRRQANIH